MSTPKKENLTISSSSFNNEEEMPSKYTCDGESVSPPFTIGNIPDGTQALALIAEDPDAPEGTFDHWLVWNISPGRIIPENTIPGITGKNSTGKTGYHAPCPPSGSHRYYFYFFALDKNLDLDAGSDKKLLKEAMAPHIIAEGSIMGRCTKVQ